MKTLVVHIPKLYEQRHAWRAEIVKEERNTLGDQQKETEYEGSIYTETMLMPNDQVLIANYTTDHLTIVQYGEEDTESEMGLIHQLLRMEIDMHPRLATFKLERRPDIKINIGR